MKDSQSFYKVIIMLVPLNIFAPICEIPRSKHMSSICMWEPQENNINLQLCIFEPPRPKKPPIIHIHKKESWVLQLSKFIRFSLK
jgi:hypothetical protein